MSETKTSQTPEPELASEPAIGPTVEASPEPSVEAAVPGRHSLRRRLVAGVVATGVLAGAGLTVKQEQSNAEQLQRLSSSNQAKDQSISELQDIVAGLTGTSREAVAGKGLGDVEKLSGYGQEVSAAEQQKMRAATVKIVARGKQLPNSPANTWFENCTGLKVGSGEHTYVVIAKHCITLDVPPQKGGYVEPSTLPAQNVTEQLSYEYGVKPVFADGSDGDVAPVTAVSEATDIDMALLKIDTTADSAKQFNAMPAITDYAERIESPLFEPGESMSVFSLPGASQGKVVQGKGIYLGIAGDPSDPSRFLQFVGLRNADMPANDACNYGASGSSAVSAHGRITGPLALRNNIHYSPGSPNNAPDDPAFSVKYLLQLQETLGLRLSEFNTICGYAAPTPDTFANVEAGFRHPLPKATFHSYTSPK